MKQIKQFRYYKDGDPRNYPRNMTLSNLTLGNIFSGYGSITQMGIQARPGTLFFLNNSQYQIAIGETGIYEIDLEGQGQIYAIRFEDLSDYEASESSARLLIDIIYEGSGADI